jgi:hypothetical protein
MRSTVMLCTLLMAVGCVRFLGPEDVRQDLSAQAGVKLKQETGVTVTRSGLWLARQFVDDEEVPLAGLRRVEVGVYEVRGLRRGVETPRRLDLRHLAGWDPMVRIQEPGEEVMVLTKQDKRDRIRSMLIVVAEDDEWVLVRLYGKLDGVIEQAMKMAFEDVDRPELYARTRHERGLTEPPEPALAATE